MKISGHILTPDGFVHGELAMHAGRIQRIEGTPVGVDDVRGSAERIVLPGFIDIHVHGGGGHDVMEGGDAARHVSTLHARHGTTALLATTMTAPTSDLSVAMGALGGVCRARPKGAARVLGVHLEGPYINPGKLGAQPNYARPAALDELRMLHALAPIRLVTLAPEILGKPECIDALRAEGFQVQIGHTLGTYEDGVAALRRGAGGFTHLFNAMTGLHHREPGMVGAALAHAQYAEIIPDLVHVHPGAIRVALRAIPCLFCVTDSTAATGMPDGDYMLGRHKVSKCMGGVRLPDGTLAGSTLTMDQALRNLVFEIGLPLDDAARRVSTHAANYLGQGERGRLAPGAWADLVVLDRHLDLQSVLVEGEVI
ncbi:N-acetylglucosamine-6-phosphate deacetylase [Verminephrobacter aporrectodeae]|uniref:N-acetylglucosamine-6-phosphate deacetylase n=1 Tax=Verminephrobacter aporrectodeae TaxID=1110389 RepID=UPI0022383B03|nr:N-acetylglucosamine-6-phosphate deacetylase [Verminephrobacter aporrectodeae]MCW5221844.1 N-acetylglucosamine-6-phosphate deacetylase [Verminephrobacter aporrectodeae subsp. tuberculatae]MCW5291135.1 N-acetylglucosamine-6-phosphate deacetylase [Verminephrobacter aporrectodeae subsp. tuberculatae]MCW8175372.1 N-acetylglucosamine-6-phosphate deacetylase [Verminephrobacter aporrectodeae subsp. tuberculatae]MCW8198303.1 N-acetylglucosamine-6-phosphate deacetylase [Verminephrobacter aporrectodeae